MLLLEIYNASLATFRSVIFSQTIINIANDRRKVRRRWFSAYKQGFR